QPNILFKSKDFPYTNKLALINIVQRSDLNTHELQVWKSIINWGVNQYPRLYSSDEEEGDYMDEEGDEGDEGDYLNNEGDDDVDMNNGDYDDDDGDDDDDVKMAEDDKENHEPLQNLDKSLSKKSSSKSKNSEKLEILKER